ncbi:hypothetical protein CYMTET_23197, partial [Cymbomonas tetramitiformis]
ASFTPPVSAVVAATAANDAPSYFNSAHTDEFAGGIEEVPPPAGPRTIEVGAHYSMGTLPVDAGVAAAVHGGGGSAIAREPVVCYGQACIYSGIDTPSPCTVLL